MSLENRLNQFKKMADADPDNELAHFSLGKAYMEAQRYDGAIDSFERVIELNPSFSRAYHYLGEARFKTGDHDSAVSILQRGFVIADENGDLMPRNAMGELLKQLGQPLPTIEKATQPASAAVAIAEASDFRCKRCGNPGPALTERPFKGLLGERILAEICAPCWNEWIAMGTKVINELQLDLSDPQSQAIYDLQMMEYLNLDSSPPPRS